MEIDRAQPGTFCWFELATSDQEAAKAFYTGLFGWTFNDTPIGPDAYYTMFQLRGRNVGAAFTMDAETAKQGVPPHWGTYVAVANADAAVEKAKSLGASVMVGPFDVSTYGRMAVLRDPTGAVVNVWEEREHCGVGLQAEVGAFCWSELLTRDTAAAAQFYTSLFGWTTKVSDSGDGGAYTHWQADGVDIGGMMAIQQEWGPMPPNWGNYVQVADCDETVAKAVGLGAKICSPPRDIPNTGRFATIQDPQGATLCVIALLPMQKG